MKDVSSLDFTLIQLFAEHKNGILPNSGGWLDQPMKYGMAMNVIESLMEKVEKDNHG